MKPTRRAEIDKSHFLLKGNLYPENHVYRHKINEAFLITEFPSDAIDCARDMFLEWEHSMPFSILAVYESQFSIEENLENDWLAKEVARMAKYLLNFPKLAYVNYPSYPGDYRQAIIDFPDILKVDEYRTFWWDFSVASKGTGSDLTQLKLQLKQELKLELKQEVKMELKEQLKQEVKMELTDQVKQEVKVELKDQLKQAVQMELKDQLKEEVKVELNDQMKQEVKMELKQELQQDLGVTLRNMVSQQVKKASDELTATFEGAKRKLSNSIRRLIRSEIKREYD